MQPITTLPVRMRPRRRRVLHTSVGACQMVHPANTTQLLATMSGEACGPRCKYHPPSEGEIAESASPSTVFCLPPRSPAVHHFPLGCPFCPPPLQGSHPAPPPPPPGESSPPPPPSGRGVNATGAVCCKPEQWDKHSTHTDSTAAPPKKFTSMGKSRFHTRHRTGYQSYIGHGTLPPFVLFGDQFGHPKTPP